MIVGDSLGDSETDGTNEIDGLWLGALEGCNESEGDELGPDDGMELGNALGTTDGRLLGRDDGD